MYIYNIYIYLYIYILRIYIYIYNQFVMMRSVKRKTEVTIKLPLST